MQDLKIPKLTNHNALSDAVTTAMIYLKLNKLGK
jgi:DNA polymerase III epsilon subunit-like protein